MSVETRITESILYRRGFPFSVNTMAWAIATDSAATRQGLTSLVATGKVEALPGGRYRRADPETSERSQP